MNRRRALASLLGFAIIVSCAGSSGSTETTTSTSTSTTTTTLAPLVSNLDIRIDENSPDAKFADSVLKTFDQIERRYPVKPGTVILLYSSEEESVAWAVQTAQEVGCLQNLTADGLRDSISSSERCGLRLRLDGRPNCDEANLCRTLVSLAANGYFKTTILQKLEPLPQNNSLWILEGAASYVGYAHTFYDTPGEIRPGYIGQLRRYLKEKARLPEINVSFGEMDKIWRGMGLANLPPATSTYLSHRAFLAVTLLIENFGEDAVLTDYLDNFAESRDHQAAFTETFGITEADFDKEFQAWIDAL